MHIADQRHSKIALWKKSRMTDYNQDHPLLVVSTEQDFFFGLPKGKFSFSLVACVQNYLDRLAEISPLELYST